MKFRYEEEESIMNKTQPVIALLNVSTLNDMVLAQAENSGLMAYLRDIVDQIKKDGASSEAVAITIACEHLADMLADKSFRSEIVEHTLFSRGWVVPFRPYNNLPEVEAEAAE
jgi:hypothetical protein